MIIEEDNHFAPVRFGIFDEECFMIEQEDQALFLTGKQLNELAKAIEKGNFNYV